MRYQPDPDERDSEPGQMVADSAGNLYIAGFVQTTHNDIDFLTLKYSPEGKLLWKRRWNGEANDCDQGRYIAVDSGGNVYVTGDSYHGDREKGGTAYDIVTLKYDANGNLLWQKSFNGPPNNDDFARGMGLDGEGNVYVQGHSHNAAKNGYYVMIKYNPAGNPVWTQTCEPDPDARNPADITLYDTMTLSSGKMVLTGTAFVRDSFGKNDWDALTACFDSSGNQLWRMRYTGEAGQNDFGYKVVVTSDSGLIMMGTTHRHHDKTGRKKPDEDVLAVKYDAAGRELWRSIVQTGNECALPTSLVADDKGGAVGIALLGVVEPSTFVVRWTGDGKATGYKNLAKYRGYRLAPHYVALSSDGSTYLAGFRFFDRWPAPPPADIYLVKLDAQMHTVWQKLYPGPLSDDKTQVLGLQKDRAGNLVIIAQTKSPRFRDITILKYTP